MYDFGKGADVWRTKRKNLETIPPVL